MKYHAAQVRRISAAVGAWAGAGVVSRMPRQRIQVVMGIALLVAAGFFAMTAMGVLLPSGTAMGLSGWRFAVAVLANFVFGALMCIGIGNYAPSMVLLGLLGMHPIAEVGSTHPERRTGGRPAVLG